MPPRRPSIRRALAHVAFALITAGAVGQAAAQSSLPFVPATTATPTVPDVAAQPAADPLRSGPQPLGEMLASARRAIERGEARQVLPELKAQAQWYAGSAAFDYLLGLAALDAGEPGLAILALERVLAVEPGHLQARAEIARAYLAARETDEARRQFEMVARHPIPDDVRRVIDAYLAGIARAEDAGRARLDGFAEIAIGWDSNVNLGSLSSQWLLAGGIAVVPEGLSRPRSSAQSTSIGGISWVVPISGRLQWIGGAQVSHRANPAAHTLDTSTLDLNTGLGWRSDCHTATMLAQYQHLNLDRDGFRDATGLMAQWRCDLSERSQVGAYAQSSDFRFPSQSVRNARRTQVGVTAARAIAAGSQVVVIGNLYVGEEKPRQDLAQLKYRLHGARAALTFAGPANSRWSASLAWEDRDYAGAEPLFERVRRDRQLEASVSVELPINRQWTVVPLVSSLRNRSNLSPNDFKRHQAQVALRFRF